MKIKYELDKDKFVKVYNELRINTLHDYFNLSSKFDKTKDKVIEDIIYAIQNNIDFEVVDIDAIKKINEMYEYYDRQDRLDTQQIISCIEELNELNVKIRTQTTTTIYQATIMGKDYTGRLEVALTLYTNTIQNPVLTCYVKQGSMIKLLDDIRVVESRSMTQGTNNTLELYKTEVSKGLFGSILKSIFRW